MKLFLLCFLSISIFAETKIEKVPTPSDRMIDFEINLRTPLVEGEKDAEKLKAIYQNECKKFTKYAGQIRNHHRFGFGDDHIKEVECLAPIVTDKSYGQIEGKAKLKMRVSTMSVFGRPVPKFGLYKITETIKLEGYSWGDEEKTRSIYKAKCNEMQRMDNTGRYFKEGDILPMGEVLFHYCETPKIEAKCCANLETSGQLITYILLPEVIKKETIKLESLVLDTNNKAVDTRAAKLELKEKVMNWEIQTQKKYRTNLAYFFCHPPTPTHYGSIQFKTTCHSIATGIAFDNTPKYDLRCQQLEGTKGLSSPYKVTFGEIYIHRSTQIKDSIVFQDHVGNEDSTLPLNGDRQEMINNVLNGASFSVDTKNKKGELLKLNFEALKQDSSSKPIRTTYKLSASSTICSEIYGCKENPADTIELGKYLCHTFK